MISYYLAGLLFLAGFFMGLAANRRARLNNRPTEFPASGDSMNLLKEFEERETFRSSSKTMWDR